MALTKQQRRQRIKYRIRKVVSGTSKRPRLSVFRSNVNIFAQLIDDNTGKTLAAASTRMKELADAKGPKVLQAQAVGKLIAQKALELGITEVVFDRGGYLYHGRVKSLADAAREGGLKF